MNQRRGLSEYPYEDYLRRKRLDAVVEVAVERSVPDLRDLVYRFEEVRPDRRAKVVFER